MKKTPDDSTLGNLNIVCVIPARGGSKRLPRKNLYPFRGKPLLQWVIEGCLESKYLHRKNIYVSTEDLEITEIARQLSINTIPRPAQLSEDHVWTQEVLEHADEYFSLHSIEYNLMVRVQANSPQIRGSTIDLCIDKLTKYKLWEVFTVDQDGVEDAAIHVLVKRSVRQKALSVYKGVVQTNYIDIHTESDIKKLDKLWSDRLGT
jgi:CMP-2-keto-3-deoxyoctulosonic acid synthetase